MNAILGRHPGLWHVATHGNNPAATHFWDAILPPLPYPPLAVRHDGMDWTVRAFIANG